MKSPRRFLQWGQFYGKQMQLKCEAWKEMNADITQVDYQIAPLDIIPGAMAVKKFSGAARTLSFADELGQLGKTTSLTNKAQNSIQKVNDFALTAGKQATARLKHVDALIMEREAKILAKLADGAIGAARVVDETVVNVKNAFPKLTPDPKLVFVEGAAKQTATNTHFFENTVKGALSKFEGLNIGGKGVPKGTGKGSSGVSEVKIFMETGQQFTNGRRNKLKPDIKYKTGEYDYFYETDNLGRISKFETENLQLTKRKERLSHSRSTPGKVKGQDHAGHLAGDRFGGSPKIDNLVSQLSDVNMKQYKRVEAKWAAALNGPPQKKVTVDVDIVYSGKDMRPEKFKIRYTIDGKFGSAEFKN